jgi:cbb3-type cytochrome oxidase subunit 3
MLAAMGFGIIGTIILIIVVIAVIAWFLRRA